MKNFFKKIAFVLALAMVLVSVAPATANAATKAPSLKKTSKILYIGGDLTGTISDSYRFTFNNAAGYTATWKSKNTKVATIEGKNVVAVGVGKTEVVATLTNKAGKSVQKTATVWVKQNAEEVGFGSTKAVDSPLAVGAKAKVNVYRLVGDKKIWTQNDMATCTDVIKWTSSNTDVATVDKFGTVTAVAAGEATITATATQPQGPTAGESASYKVTVAAGIQSVKQTGLTTAQITFAGNVSAEANKDNVTVKSMVGSTGVKVAVKDLKFDAVDKTKATITTFTEFAKDTEYVVSYKDTSASFVGVDTSKDAVASIKFDTTDVVKAKAETIKFKVYDKNGVDITREEFTNRIDVSLVNATTDCYLDSSAKTITFFTSGKTAEVKATYHTYTYGADYKEITIDAVGTIVSKDVASTTIKSVDVFTAYTGDVDFTKPNKTISVSDTDGSYKVAVKTTNNDGKELSSVGNVSDDKFTFESSDTTTLLIVGDQLYPVKEGGAMVIVKYNKTVIDAYAVTIGSKRVAADVTAKFDRAQLATNASDSVKLTVTVKDQFGAERTKLETIDVKFVSGPKDANQTVPTATVGKNNEFVFEGSIYNVIGGYQYKVTVGNQVRYVGFTTDKAVGTPSFYQLSNTGKAIDTALKVGNTNKTDDKEFKLGLAGYASNGYKILNVPMADGKTVAFDSIPATATGSAVYVEVQGPANKDITPFISVSADGQVVVKPVVMNASGAAIKAPAGNYTVSVFEMNKTNASQTKDNVPVKALIVGGFSITDTQQVPSIAVNSTTSKYGSALLALQDKDDVVTIKIGDTVVNDKVTAVTVIGTGKQIAVTEVTIAVDVNYNGAITTFEQKVPVGVTINLQ
ncbi:MAG TPA: hypothetical protein DHW61_18665 [Lachnoclostridium phytofermentans]|uniref:BIG2 domain-containing protein n=1 Tax=Lachnoclostridium phytofermentans TaxID=66219 RepID=A0A3D2XBC1_9FIRM|nr:Ig-like domain-containing protein [Lachnoclostridium sp.]HCL04401.1 hypothetical protein [Lachnoclostridium phytofermentans]